MTEREATAVLSILKAAYPSSYRDLRKKEAQCVITVWTLQLADVPAGVAFLAIQKLISTSKFPPSVAEVRAQVKQICHEASEILSVRESRARMIAYLRDTGPESHADEAIPECGELERQAMQIVEATKDFNPELSLGQLMQNEVLKKAVENPCETLNLALIGAKTND